MLMQRSGCSHCKGMIWCLWHFFMIFLLPECIFNWLKLIGQMVSKSDRTVREWRAVFLCNGNSYPDSLQGKYQRQGVLWQNEELNHALWRYVRENACAEGRPNMTALSFCHWVNDELLPNQTLSPGYPRRISIETAHTCLHKLEFHILGQKRVVI